MRPGFGALDLEIKGVGVEELYVYVEEVKLSVQEWGEAKVIGTVLPLPICTHGRCVAESLKVAARTNEVSQN